MRINKITTNFNSLHLRMSKRITTPVDVYNIMLKLNTEQETGGEFDTLLYNIEEIYKDKEFSIDLRYEIFPGREDIIFELNIIITIHKGSALDIKDLDTEPILGTVFKEIREHFNLYYKSYSDDISLDMVKHYFRGY
jgi:hypothetical protein